MWSQQHCNHIEHGSVNDVCGDVYGSVYGDIYEDCLWFCLVMSMVLSVNDDVYEDCHQSLTLTISGSTGGDHWSLLARGNHSRVWGERQGREE